jgi:hypothetical protein
MTALYIKTQERNPNYMLHVQIDFHVTLGTIVILFQGMLMRLQPPLRRPRNGIGAARPRAYHVTGEDKTQQGKRR